MPKSIHKSAEIHLKTIRHLKESKHFFFLGVVGRRVGFRASKWSQMDQHGATWSEKDTKREPKATKMEPKAPKVRQKATQKQKKTMFRKGRSNDGSRTKKFGFLSRFSRKCRPKGAFLEIPKIENGTKIQLFSKDRHRDPLKRDPGSGFEKT